MIQNCLFHHFPRTGRAVKATAVILVFFFASVLMAAPITIKIAAQIPENSPIGMGLLKMAAAWKQVSGGTVIMKPFLGGALGDDESMRQKMNTGLLDGAVFTSAGMTPIVQDFMAISAPSLIRDRGEMAAALKAMEPILKRKLDEKGYAVLAMTPGGWIRLFSRSPIATPDDMRKQKLAVSPYDGALLQLFKVLGMNVVTVPSTSMLQQFQSRGVDVMYTSPVYFSYQWSSYSKVITSMTNLRLSPFLGCIIVKKSVWEKVEPATRAAIVEASEKVATAIETEMMSKEETVIKDLASYGLDIVEPTEADSKLWREAFSQAIDNDKVEAFPRESVALIRKAVADYRAQKK